MYGSLTGFQWRITLARQLLHLSRRSIQTSSVIYRAEGKKYRLRTKPFISDGVPPAAKDAAGSHEFYKSLLSRQLRTWAHSPMTLGRFKALGVTQVESRMVQFAKFIYPELQKSGPLDDELWNPELITDNMENTNFTRAVDIALSGRFIAWITEILKGTPEGELLSNFRKAVDFRAYAWKFVDTRSMRRKVIMHVGPTNSGKTYTALRKLAAARTGFYAGPLRLLAHEVYDRLNRGLIPPHGQSPGGLFPKACNMQTGEEIRIVHPDAGIVSCTTEMLQLTRLYDVGVVDEVQLMEDKQRGVAWTTAILGAMCNELHLCGEESAVPLVKSLLADTADEIIINRYRRLSPLKVDALSLGSNWQNVRKGDCVVTFSRKRIFELKQIIEKVTGLRCAVAYGSLPPEVRVEQATLFNNSDNDYDVMVASDAIGLGLNL
jgi:ATP-dependent RNA helicase SUPV3L1/SUV3